MISNSESIGILNSILQDCTDTQDLCENNLTLDLIRYQISNLLVQQNKPDDAIIFLEAINGDGIYTELSIIFLAEIYDYIKNDEDMAIQHYLLILQEYPQSIYYEIIRKRLRTILEKTLLDTMYDLPSSPEITKVVIDKTVIKSSGKPLLIYGKNKTKANSKQ